MPCSTSPSPERLLQLDDDRRLVTAHAHDIAAADLALDLVALRYEQGLHRGIEVGLGYSMSAVMMASAAAIE